MNVPRYWRMQQHNYRLTGVVYSTGQKSIVNRPRPAQTVEIDDTQNDEQEHAQTTAA